MRRVTGLIVVLLLVCVPTVMGCGGDDEVTSDECRFFPERCNGGAGGLCRSDEDCIPGLVCCQDDSNCGGGMCTLECDDDRECPVGMLCEHHMCFYACQSDLDCADGMSCEHGRTICEYP